MPLLPQAEILSSSSGQPSTPTKPWSAGG